ncbi:protein FAM117A isoform X2 [Electrophorus electricus]|uniref:protein FAM117A isoform X2 n=1 Tax=Electrophorus electricus TaxID=8005 RepID=UPI0015D033A3|nr:protein FAM117A isoform X2 [Electrophorus electricus]
MSSNGGREGMARETSLGPGAQPRESNPGLQPLRATVPFQLHRKTRADLRNVSPAEKAQVLPQVKIRRALSSDAIVGPYLQGQWPRDGDESGRSGQKDQFTQTWWPDEAQRRISWSHRRSASWGHAEHLQDIAKLKQQLQQKPKPGVHVGILEKPHYPLRACVQSQSVPMSPSPLSRLPSVQGHGEEGLDQELERAFIRHSPILHSRLLEVPDGHRAPVPTLSSRGSVQSEALSFTHPSSSLSPCASPQCLHDLDTDQPGAGASSCPSPLPSPMASSPRPNKSYCFQREPPEGCERVPVCEENTALCKDQAYLTYCPDPNKVNFTPHGGSAFCPVNLLKPLLPSVDFLFRSLSVSPVSCWAGQAGARQTPPVLEY